MVYGNTNSIVQWADLAALAQACSTATALAVTEQAREGLTCLSIIKRFDSQARHAQQVNLVYCLVGLHQAALQQLPWGLHLCCAHGVHRLGMQPDTAVTAATEQH